ncbi:MAG TPA: hypothetical protein VGA40_02920 [Candidatus Acidoferrales bacterium]
MSAYRFVSPFLVLTLWTAGAAGAASLSAQAAAQRDVGPSFGRDIEVRGVADDVICYGCNVTVRGVVLGDVIVIGGSVLVDTVAQGNIIVVGGSVTVGAAAEVRAMVIVVGGTVERQPGSRVAAEVVERPWWYVPGQRDVLWRGALAMLLFNIFVALLSYGSLRARRTMGTISALRRHPWTTLLIGAVLNILLLSIFVVGDAWLWLEEYGWMVYIILFMIFYLAGFGGVCRMTGGWVLRSANNLTAILCGAVLLTAAMMIPIAGILFFALITSAAFGAAVVTRCGARDFQAAAPQ